MEKNDAVAMKDEMGDILFTCVNLSRHLGINLEQSLQDANDKFLKRFVRVEQICREQGLDMQAVPFTQLIELWELAKQM